MRAVRAIAMGIGVAGVALVMSLSATAASTTQDPPAKPAAAGQVTAAEIYKTRCQGCHADGNSPMPNMSFADGIWRHGSTIKEVTNTITNGVPATAMMPFKTQLSPAEIAAMARYVRKFDKKL